MIPPAPPPTDSRRVPPPPRPLSGLRSPARPPVRTEPGLKDVAAGWVASHPAAGLGVSAAAGVLVGWLLKRR